MRIGWIPANLNETEAAFRYRVLMPMKALSDLGHTNLILENVDTDKFDVVIFGRAYQKLHIQMATRLAERKVPAAFDVSDNHVYNPYRLPKYDDNRKRLTAMLGAVSAVICTTPTLAKAMAAEMPRPLPTHIVADYCERVACPTRRPAQRPTLLWFGNAGSPNAPSGMADLHLIAEHLRAAHSTYDFELVVSSSDPARYVLTLGDLGVPTRYVPWTQESFPELLSTADAVLIPATRSPFVDAKSANRITLALMAGVPVLASGIPSYQEFAPWCHLDDWKAGLEEVLGNPSAAREKAAAGGAYIERVWSDQRITMDWATAIEALANRQSA